MRSVVTLGVDTHSDMHVVAVLDHLGRLLGTRSFPATGAGYSELLSWVRSFGEVLVAGVEGTGSYGAGLTRYLISNHVQVLEVGRPNRQDRRRLGKSDPADAEAAARSVLAGTHLGLPKTLSGPVESIRVLRIARRSALAARVRCRQQIRSLLVTVADDVRGRLSSLPYEQLVVIASRFRASSDPTSYALRLLARRYLYLSAEIGDLDARLALLVALAAPDLVALPGFGTDTAGALLVAAGDNPHRLRSEASFAHLCGVAPIPASSGKTVRHRLNRGGNRIANSALHFVALTRMSTDSRTKLYVARRTSEGKTKKEIIRCLKRYIAREAYKVLVA